MRTILRLRAQELRTVSAEESFFIRACMKTWVAVKELKLSYLNGETLLFTIYTHYGNLI